MKVILTKTVPHVGKALDVVDVKDGFALNFLIPQGKARLATAGDLKNLEIRRAKMAEKQSLSAAQATELAGALKTLGTLVFQAKASEKGHLFAAITVKDVVEKLHSEHALELDPKQIHLMEVLKTVGQHPLEIQVQEHKVKIMVEIQAK